MYAENHIFFSDMYVDFSSIFTRIAVLLLTIQKSKGSYSFSDISISSLINELFFFLLQSLVKNPHILLIVRGGYDATDFVSELSIIQNLFSEVGPHRFRAQKIISTPYLTHCENVIQSKSRLPKYPESKKTRPKVLSFDEITLK